MKLDFHEPARTKRARSKDRSDERFAANEVPGPVIWLWV